MKSFGRSIHVDLYNVQVDCDDIQLFYNLLEDLPKFLRMDLMAPPYIFRLNSDCPWPDKAGLTGFVPLVQSGITVHTLTPKQFVTIDIYTCGNLDIIDTIGFLTLRLSPQKTEYQFLERGINYNADDN